MSDRRVVLDFLGQTLDPDDFVLVPRWSISGAGYKVGRILHCAPKVVKIDCETDGVCREQSVHPNDLVKISEDQLVWYKLKK
jgi:hypothetical protein